MALTAVGGDNQVASTTTFGGPRHAIVNEALLGTCKTPLQPDRGIQAGLGSLTGARVELQGLLPNFTTVHRGALASESSHLQRSIRLLARAQYGAEPPFPHQRHAAFSCGLRALRLRRAIKVAAATIAPRQPWLDQPAACSPERERDTRRPSSRSRAEEARRPRRSGLFSRWARPARASDTCLAADR